MSTTAPNRSFGPAAALAWIAWGAFEASSRTVYGDDSESALDYANMALLDLALVLTAIAVTRIATGHGQALGGPGRLAARGMTIGAGWLALFATLDAAYPDTAVLEGLAIVGMVAFWITGLVFAVALSRARVFPRWLGPALALTMLAFPPLSELGGSIALGAVLLAIWAMEREGAEAVRPATKAAA